MLSPSTFYELLAREVSLVDTLVVDTTGEFQGATRILYSIGSFSCTGRLNPSTPRSCYTLCTSKSNTAAERQC
jgi:hypothetical protein